MNLEQPITILLQRRAALGDVVLTTGVVRELHKKYNGQCIIHVATDFPEVFNNNPYVNHTFMVKDAPPANHYNVFYNLDDTYELNPNISFVNNYTYRVFGDTTVDGSMELYVDEATAQAVETLLAAIDSEFVCLHMRNWHWGLKNIQTEIWLSVIDKVLEKNDRVKIVCVGGKTDLFPENHPRIVDGRNLSVAALSYLLDYSRCFVGIDSAPFHIAGTSETHIIALLSHMHPEKVLPVRNGKAGTNCTVIQADVPCVGCHSRQQRPIRQIVCERPPEETYICNRAWNPDTIANAILKQL